MNGYLRRHASPASIAWYNCVSNLFLLIVYVLWKVRGLLVLNYRFSSTTSPSQLYQNSVHHTGSEAALELTSNDFLSGYLGAQNNFNIKFFPRLKIRNELEMENKLEIGKKIGNKF